MRDTESLSSAQILVLARLALSLITIEVPLLLFDLRC